MTKAIPKLASILLGALFVFCLFVFAPAMARADGGCLEFTASADQSGTGWTWNASTKTLTLSGATFNDCVWLKVDSATIVLNGDNYMHGGVYGTKNSTSPDLKAWSGICVGESVKAGDQQNFSSKGTLKIKGSGSLNITPNTNDSYWETFGINCYQMEIGTGSDAPQLNFTLQKATFHSYAIQAWTLVHGRSSRKTGCAFFVFFFIFHCRQCRAMIKYNVCSIGNKASRWPPDRKQRSRIHGERGTQKKRTAAAHCRDCRDGRFRGGVVFPAGAF